MTNEQRTEDRGALSPEMQRFLWQQQEQILAEANPLLRVELEREWREEGLWIEKPAG